MAPKPKTEKTCICGKVYLAKRIDSPCCGDPKCRKAATARTMAKVRAGLGRKRDATVAEIMARSESRPDCHVLMEGGVRVDKWV